MPDLVRGFIGSPDANNAERPYEYVRFWVPMEVRAAASTNLGTPQYDGSTGIFDLGIVGEGFVYGGTEWSTTVWLGSPVNTSPVTLEFNIIRGFTLPQANFLPRTIIFAIGSFWTRGVLMSAEATFHGPFNGNGEPAFAEVSLTIKEGVPIAAPQPEE